MWQSWFIFIFYPNYVVDHCYGYDSFIIIFKLVIVLGKGFSVFLDAKILSFWSDLKFEGQLYILCTLKLPIYTVG